MKIVIEGTVEECAYAIQKLCEVLPCVAVSTDRREVSAEFRTPEELIDLPCPHSRPSWRMCPHCNGVNDMEVAGTSAARTPGAVLELHRTVLLPANVGTIEMSLKYGEPQCASCGGKNFTVDGPCIDCASRRAG